MEEDTLVCHVSVSVTTKVKTKTPRLKSDANVNLIYGKDIKSRLKTMIECFRSKTANAVYAGRIIQPTVGI